MQRSALNMNEKGFFSLALSPQVVIRAVRVALIVGTILAFINHGNKILTLATTYQDLFKIILTYFVPYCVSTWSSVRAIEAHANTVA